MLGILALFICVPLIELYLLLVVGGRIGAWPTVGVVVLTGLVGASLARWQGAQAWREIRGDLASGRVPADSILSGMLILAAGLLLITPGLVTDLVGFALLVPRTRWIAIRRLRKRLRHSISAQIGSNHRFL